MDESSMMESTALIPRTDIPLISPDNQRTNGRRLAVYLILASTVFERLAFYSLAINLVVTLKSSELQWNSSSSTTASFVFLGTSYVSSLLFAIISDAKLGRAKTIIIGFILYLMGYILIILIANGHTHTLMCKETNATHTSVFSEHCGGQIISILIFIAIGVGAVQVNMAVFGAEQIEDSKLAARYFDKYFLAVNIGATIATLSIPLIQSDPDNQTNPTNYFYGYLTAIFMLISAIVLFLIGYRYYVHIPPLDSVILRYIPVMINAFQTRRQHRITRNILMDERVNQDERTLSFLDYASVDNQGRFHDRTIHDVKAFQRAIIVFLLLIPYWIIYYQMQVTFPLQGEQMTIPYLNKYQMVPISWMTLGDSITIIVGILILLIFVYKYLDTWNRIISIKIKLIIGMMFAALTMCITGIVELIREKYCLPSLDINHSSLSILFQLPQNICMGLAEIFATVASFEFAYLAAPRSAQTLFMSLQFCSLGISSFISNGYFSIYSTSGHFDFSCSNPTQWSYSTYFFLLAVLQLVFMLIIILCERKYQLLKINLQQIQIYQFQEN